MVKQIIDFFKHGVWQQDRHVTSNGKEKWYVRASKIIIYTVKGLGEHDVAVRAAALTFFTLMSVVPIAALIFGIMKGFGLQASMGNYLYQNFSQYTSVVGTVLQFANNMLGRTSGGVVASVGFVILFWSVLQVFGNIERAFNNIWEVRKERSLSRKFSDYIAVIFVAPILWIISANLVSTVRSSMISLTEGFSWTVEVLFGLSSLVVIWLIFAFVYYMMPNTKVKFQGALIAGIISGTLFQVFQLGYVFIQGYLTSYNVIYGSFAALPLFLIWLQWSWMILLVGAELSFAYQNISKYEQERQSHNMCYDRRRKVILAAMITIVRHYIDNDGAVNSENIADELGMPVRIVRDVLFDLEQAGLIVAVQSTDDDKVSTYIPARDVHFINVCDVINGVECNANASLDISFDDNPKLAKASAVMDNIKSAAMTAALNIPITELTER